MQLKKMMAMAVAVAFAVAAWADTWTDSAGYTWTYRINGNTAEIYGRKEEVSTPMEPYYIYTSAISPSPSGAVTIPDTLGGKPVTRIGYYAFYGCGGLTSVTIPNSVTSIGASMVDDSGAFYGCFGLKSVTVPQCVCSLGLRCFFSSASITNVVISDGVTSIGNGAFEWFSSLTSVAIPDSVTSIGERAFSGCSGLTSVTIPNSVTSIGGSAFEGCSGLTSVTIGNGVTSVGNGAFWGCRDSLFDTTTIPGVKLVDGWAVGNTGSLSGDLDLTGIRGIGPSAFYNCSGLTSVTIPDSVTSIGSRAFGGCNGLMTFAVGSGNACYKSISGLLLSRDGTTLVAVACGLTSVTIPDSVTSIGDYSFSGCSGLTSVTIPDSVTSIGGHAFDGCSGLTSIVIGNGVTSMGEAILYDCNSVECLTAPLFQMSYYGLSGLFMYDTYYYAPDPLMGGTTEHHGSIPTSLKSVVVTGTQDIPASAFKELGNITNIVISGKVASIGDEAFYNCTALEHLTIPDSVTSFGVNCFEGCPAYTLQLYRSIFGGGGAGGGSSSVVTTVVQQASTTVVQQVEVPYALTDHAADRAIASVTVDADCSIDSFVLKDGKVYDCVVRIVNTASRDVKLTLPSGYVYETFEGIDPLTIPANSRNILSITRTADKTFLVSREKLKTVE